MRYDSIVIGAGQAGPSLAVRLAKAGQRVALVERKALGGTCVNTGCMPTKTLVASARAAWVLAQAARWGVHIEGDVHVDMKAIKARKDAIVRESVESLERWLTSTENLDLIMGHARFESPTRIRVGEVSLEADRFFLNLGARASQPSIEGLESTPHLSNASLLDLERLPEHLLILGGSYIGLEFAQMYRRFGSKVSLIERGPRLAPKEDDDVSEALYEFLSEEGIEFHLESQVTRVEAAREGVRVYLQGRPAPLSGSHLLLALGRRPNTDDLDLHKAGVSCDARGYIQVDDTLRTNLPHIYAMGDVHGRGAFTHTSYNDYEILAQNLLEGGSRKLSDRIPTYALFTDPPLGRVGMSEREARASGRKIRVCKRPMTRVGRAREMGETLGFIKVVVDLESQEILGAAILGVHGDEAVHCITDTMYAKASYTTLRDAVHIHPTVSELIPTVLSF